MWSGEGVSSEGVSSAVYGQRIECVGEFGSGTTTLRSGSPCEVEYSHSSAYLVCVQQLLSGFTDQNLAVSIR